MAQERNTSPIAKLAVVDVEVGISDHKIHDIGAVRHDGSVFHQSSKEGLLEFLENVDIVCGSASVRFIVAWRPKDAGKSEPEIPVVLADIVLERKRGVDSQESM